MIGEIFAYYYGKSVGRSKRRGHVDEITREDVGWARIVALIVVICMVLLVLVVIFTDSPN